MILPKLRVIISSLLIFCFLSISSPVFAQLNPSSESVTPINTSQETASETAGAAAIEQGETKGVFIPVLVIAGTALTAYLFKDVIGKAIDCSKNLAQCAEDVLYAGENAAYKQIQGCDFEAPNADGVYPADSCTGTKIRAYKNGVSFKELPNPGLADIASLTLNTSLSLPVPVSSGQYLASINPFQTAQAEGGAQNLSNNDVILGLWRSVQRASLVMMVVVLIIVGFMIMFRFRLDPRTVVTAQNALPRVVVSLILISFSFAIAGLMVDVARLLTSLMVNVLGASGASIGHMISLTIASLFTAAGIGGLLVKVLPAAVSGWGLGFVVILLLVALIIALIIFAVFAVLIFKIITRYVIFLLLTIFAPVFFLIGSLPGMEGVTFTWFKRAAAALIAIPATALFVHLAFIIGFSSFGPGAQPLPMPWIVPGFINGILQWTILGPAVGIGLFFFATKVPDIVDEMFQIRPLPRGGIGPGSLFVTPFMAAGQAGRSIGGLESAGKTANVVGGWLGGKGWGARPPATGVGGRRVLGPAPPAEGVGARFARFARQYTPFRFVTRERPWKTRVQTEKEQEQARERAGRGPQETPPTEDRGPWRLH